MQTLKKTLFVAVLMIAIVSCSDEYEFINENKSQGELIGEKIIELTQSENVTLATTYSIHREGITVNREYDEIQKPFEVDGSILKVGETYYNLALVLKYEIEPAGGEDVLYLQFENL